MFYTRTGLPEESENVMCTVTKIQYSSIFVNIDFFNTSGMIHISEIAAGRIRNIRDYVKEGKKIVCKVLRVNHEKGQVDLSLRRVTENQRRALVNEIKMEQKAEAVIEYLARQNKLQAKELYDKIGIPLLNEYPFVHYAFEDFVAGNIDFSKIKLDKKMQEQLKEIVMQRFKPKLVELNGTLKLSTYDSNGVEIVKTALKEAQSTKGMTIKYLGGGKYRLTVTANDYKEGEPLLKEGSEKAIAYMKQYHGIGDFSKE
jgi:translation initiation factor 2 subunit 1